MNTFRDVLDDLASDVRPVDLSPRVTAGVRRRKQRRAAGLAAVTAFVVTVSGVAVSALLRERIEPPASPAPSGYVYVWETYEGPGRTLRAQGTDGKVAELGTFDGNAIDLAADGKRIAYVSPRGLEVMSLTDRTRRTYGKAPGIDAAFHVTPRWSADGRTIAYPYMDTSFQSRAVYAGFVLVDTVTDEATAVPYRFLDDLAWSPDGTTLAVGRYHEGPTARGIDLVSRTGRRVKTLAGTGWAIGWGHGWSPDGRRLIVTKGSSDATLVVSVATGKVVAELPWHQYVWRTPDTVVAEKQVGVLEQRTLDDRLVSTERIDHSTSTNVGNVAIRPAS